MDPKIKAKGYIVYFEYKAKFKPHMNDHVINITIKHPGIKRIVNFWLFLAAFITNPIRVATARMEPMLAREYPCSSRKSGIVTEMAPAMKPKSIAAIKVFLSSCIWIKMGRGGF